MLKNKLTRLMFLASTTIIKRQKVKQKTDITQNDIKHAFVIFKVVFTDNAHHFAISKSNLNLMNKTRIAKPIRNKRKTNEYHQ